MIKTLRITSLIAAVIAAILLILPAVFGVRSDPEIEEFLNSPGAVEKFLADKDRRPVRSENQTSPLVKQASDFNLYLNPPPPPPSPSRAPARATSREVRPAPPTVTPKFKLIGTSFYAARPELSLALIDEPGKGLSWVRQGSSVGHLTIEQIKDGSITIRDSQGTSEMSVKFDQPWRGLLKNPPPEVTPSGDIDSLPSDSTAPAPVVRGRPGFITSDSRASATPRQNGVIQPAAQTKVEQVPEEVYEPSPLEKEKDAEINRLMAEIGENRITEDEAAKLDELTKLIEELGEIRAQQYEAGLRQESDTNSPAEANQ